MELSIEGFQTCLEQKISANKLFHLHADLTFDGQANGVGRLGVWSPLHDTDYTAARHEIGIHRPSIQGWVFGRLTSLSFIRICDESKNNLPNSCNVPKILRIQESDRSLSNNRQRVLWPLGIIEGIFWFRQLREIMNNLSTRDLRPRVLCQNVVRRK